MELKKCKCGSMDWIMIVDTIHDGDRCYLICNECDNPYPSPVAEALEFINDVIENDLEKYRSTSTAWKYAPTTMEEILKTFKELKQILEKGEQ